MNATTDLVAELRKFPSTPAIELVIDEALAGYYNDFGSKYSCPKLALNVRLEMAGLGDLADRVRNGEFDD